MNLKSLQKKIEQRRKQQKICSITSGNTWHRFAFNKRATFFHQNDFFFACRHRACTFVAIRVIVEN